MYLFCFFLVLRFQLIALSVSPGSSLTGFPISQQVKFSLASEPLNMHSYLHRSLPYLSSFGFLAPCHIRESFIGYTIKGSSFSSLLSYHITFFQFASYHSIYFLVQSYSNTLIEFKHHKVRVSIYVIHSGFLELIKLSQYVEDQCISGVFVLQ